jgi:putative endonuclease
VFYVYVLRSIKDGKFYVGFTSNLKERISRHNKGAVESTRLRKPFVLEYYEACLNQHDALRREKYLKTTYGKRYIRNRIREHLAEK